MITLDQLEKISEDLDSKEEKKYYDDVHKIINSTWITTSIADIKRRGSNAAGIFSERYHQGIDYEKIFCTPYYGDSISLIDQLKNKFPEPDFRIDYGTSTCCGDIINYHISIRWGTFKHCDYCCVLF